MKSREPNEKNEKSKTSTQIKSANDLCLFKTQSQTISEILS